MRRQIDGLLVVPSGNAEPYESMVKNQSVPVVFFDQPHPGKDFDAILVKNRQGARAAVQHLIEHGHRRIAGIGVYRHLYSIRKRAAGYREAIREAGLKDYLVLTEPEQIDEQIGELMSSKTPPTAIFSLNELSSVKIVEALGVRHLRMPDQIAFVGFDEVQLGRFLDPPLSAVVQPASAIGEQAALRLLERLEASSPLPGKQIMLPTSFICRRSCGCTESTPA